MDAPHTPVLLTEVVQLLDPQPGETVVDATVGAGGHAEALLERVQPGGRLIGIDADPYALALTTNRLARFGSRVQLLHGTFDDILPHIHVSLPSHTQPHRLLFDLGLSSFALDGLSGDRRGFSFLRDAPLDMRFNPEDERKPTAAAILQTFSITELTNLFRAYGEERFAKPIAQAIGRTRKRKPIRTTRELDALVMQVYAEKLGSGPRRRPFVRGVRPSTRIFQALRIKVNDELGSLTRALPEALELLAPGGRMAVISFHSLEDRIVKNFFRDHARGEDATLTVLTKKPVRPSDEEVAANPRSRSAKLRAIEKLPANPNSQIPIPKS